MTSREIAEYRALFLIEAREDETPAAPVTTTTPEDDIRAALARAAKQNLEKLTSR